MDRIYLDNNATTEPAPQVQEAMAQALSQLWANPSSLHRFGQEVRQRVDLARGHVARLIGGRDRHLIFTSGGTESNNLALRGLLGTDTSSPGRTLLVTTSIEHAAIAEPTKTLAKMGAQVIYLPIHRGRVNPTELGQTLRGQMNGHDRALVSIQWANNETGTIQPMPDLVETCQQCRDEGRRVILHSDATQAVGKIAVDVAAVKVDLMSFSAHKFHGPKGLGLLYVRPGVRLRPQNEGGPQERQRRGGTENTAGIIGAGVAAELAQIFLEDSDQMPRCKSLRDHFENEVTKNLPDAVVHHRDLPRLWNTSNIAFPRLEAEAILVGLSERGLCASAGAACSSGSLEPSPVLLAMDIAAPLAHGSIRFSLSRTTSREEIEKAARIVVEVVQRVARTMPVRI